jgi:hypothetical protein
MPPIGKPVLLGQRGFESGEPGGDLVLLIHLPAIQLLDSSFPGVELFCQRGDAPSELLDRGEGILRHRTEMKAGP